MADLLPASIATSKPIATPTRGANLERARSVPEPSEPPLALNGVPCRHAAPEAHSTSTTRDAELLILADTLDDLEHARKAAASRLEALTRSTEKQGKGLKPEQVPSGLRSALEGLKTLEEEAARHLQRAMRRHPLGPWVKATVGIGDKQAARLLAAIGDPADRATVSALRQYCGHGDPERSQVRKGARVDGCLPFNPTAKMRLHLIAAKCVEHNGKPDKNGRARGLSPYRRIYDEARMDWAHRDTTDGHKHNHAVRMVGKEILKDLWVEARRLRAVESS